MAAGVPHCVRGHCASALVSRLLAWIPSAMPAPTAATPTAATAIDHLRLPDQRLGGGRASASRSRGSAAASSAASLRLASRRALRASGLASSTGTSTFLLLVLTSTVVLHGLRPGASAEIVYSSGSTGTR